MQSVSQTRTILWVEDNPNDETLIKRALSKSDLTFQLVVVHDGEEALDYIQATGAYEGRDPKDLPVVVLLDLKLPKVDGLEVLQRLREDPRTTSLPVVILTSSDERRDLAESYRLRANSYIRKPIKFRDFAETVRQVSQYWVQLNEPLPRGGEVP